MSLNISIYDFLGQETQNQIILPEGIFGIELRHDIMARVVQWQLACRRSGNHKTKGISDVSGTTKKPFKQKGTGRARQGSLRSPQMRGGGIIFGPVVRDHDYSLPKKVRRLGLKSALSARFSEGNLRVVQALDLPETKAKTRELVNHFQGKSTLLVTGNEPSPLLMRAIRNIPLINVLPQQGLNVYDIIRHEQLILAQEVLTYLEKRLHV